MTALDVKQAKQALSWRLAQWGVTNDVEGKAASFVDDLVSQGWQMAPERESRPRPPKNGEQCGECNRAAHEPDRVCSVPSRPRPLRSAPPPPAYLDARRDLTTHPRNESAATEGDA